MPPTGDRSATMNPGTVLGQSIAACLLLTATAVLGRPVPAGVLALAGLIWVLALNRAYARRLGTQGRTERRISGDRAIARQLLVSYGTPLAIAAALIVWGHTAATSIGPFSDVEVQAIAGISAAMLVAWLVSSHTDWYYVRPRIDGVTEVPPCQSSRDSRWKGVTRKWYIHRTFASLVTMLWAVAFALVVTVMLNREWPSAIGQIGGFAAIVSVALWLMRSEITSAGATSSAIRSPRYWLGDDLSYETDFWRRRGFVLHIAIPATKLVPLTKNSGRPEADAEPFDEVANVLHTARIRPRRFHGCSSAEACTRLNKECVFFQQREEVGVQHLLVL